MRNHLLDVLKALQARKSVGIDPLHNRPHPRQDPKLSYGYAEIVRRFSGRLAPRELECVRLRAAGLNYKEESERADRLILDR